MLQADEKFLSVNWREHFGDIGLEAQRTEIREQLALSLASSGGLAVWNVGKILDPVQGHSERSLVELTCRSVRDQTLTGDDPSQFFKEFSHPEADLRSPRVR